MQRHTLTGSALRVPSVIVFAGICWSFVCPWTLAGRPLRAGEPGGAAATFRRGDVNMDGRFDLSDPISTLLSLFVGGAPIACKDAADTNDDGRLDISDPLYALAHLFLGGAAPAAPGMECGEDPTEDGLGCERYWPCSLTHGASDFASPLSGAPGYGRGLDDAAFGGPDGNAPPTPQPEASPGPERMIEEADLYKLVGEHLFVLNRYRGLQIVDLTDRTAPVVIGSAPIFGYPLEMYVRDSTAYVIVSDYYEYWRDPTSELVSVHGFYGSQLRIVDISDVRNPTVAGGINLEGELSDSRIVGDVMYLVANRYPWYGGYGTNDSEDKTQVISVSVGDPDDVAKIDVKDFPRNGWEHHIYVTQQAVYLASSGWSGDTNRYETTVRYIDISDPAGMIRVRGEARVPGRVQDRWAMDEYEGVLRVVSGASWGNGDVYLTTYSVSDPDAIVRLGQRTLHVEENLMSARFDGPRGYLVTYRTIDPLFTFDLSDPASPRLLGELEMTGWLDFIVPMGDRLVALGHEDIADPNTGWRSLSLAVSLIDVSSQEKPKLLSRVSLDSVWGWVPGDRDDFAKVFRTLPGEQLILFPFQAWSKTEHRSIAGVQLIDLFRDELVLRGLIEDAGWVERGIPYDASTVLTLSSEQLQVVDISDRDHPRVEGRLELARNVLELALLGGEHTVQLIGDWYRGDTQLIVTSKDDPNAAQPISKLHLGAAYARMFANGDFVYVASVESIPVVENDVQTERSVTKVQVVDLSDPTQPVLRGSVVLPEAVWPSYRYWYWGSGDEVVQVKGSTLVFHRYRYPYFWDCFDCRVMVGPRFPGEWKNEHKVYLVDLADADQPVLASTLTLENAEWAWGLKASGTMLYLSFYESFLEKGGWMARYYLARIEVADPANPVVLPEVNIPGTFLDAKPGTPLIYTLESWWDQTAQTTLSFLHALAIVGDKAYLQSSVALDGYNQGIEIEGDAAVTVLGWWGPVVAGDMASPWISRTSLATIDLRDPQNLRVAASTRLPADYAYLQEVEGDQAFVGAGSGLFTYDVADIEAPVFEKFFRTQGWTQDIVVDEDGDRAFVPSGYYGVQVLDLSAGPGL